MIPPARGRLSRGQVVTGASIPASVGGWDAQKPLANMPAQNAVFLDNWIPRSGYTEPRKGYSAYLTHSLSTVETLVSWRGAGSQKLLACAGVTIKNASASGSAGAASTFYSSASNAQWQYVNFANDAGQFAILVNGANTPQRFNGTTIAGLTITGSSGSITLTSTNLIDVMAHKRRLHFIEKNTLRVWFLDTDAIQGTAQLLDLGPIFDKGGVLACMGTWSVDGGQGTDDFAAYMTDQGQVAIYQGTDPSDATNWALVGVFSLGLPLGRRAILKYGADLAILTSDGVIPMSQALNLDRAQDNLVALTAKIENAFFTAAAAYRTNFGWQGMLYQKGSLAIFNVPISSTVSQQYVQNVQTGAWCRFVNINAKCWAIHNEDPYFGASDGVYKFDTVSSDNGSDLVADSLTAFNYFGERGRQKKFEMMRPILSTSQPISPAVAIAPDFNTNAPISTPTPPSSSGGIWGTGLWNTAIWAGDQISQYPWNGVQAIGYCGAARTKIILNSPYAVEVKLIGYDITFQPGGIL